MVHIWGHYTKLNNFFTKRQIQHDCNYLWSACQIHREGKWNGGCQGRGAKDLLLNGYNVSILQDARLLKIVYSKVEK